MTQNTKTIASIPTADAELIARFARDAARLAVAVTAASSYVGSDLATKRTITATLIATRTAYNNSRETLINRCGPGCEALVDKLNVRARAYEIIRLHNQQHHASLPTADFLDVATKLYADMSAVANIIVDRTKS